MQKTEIQNLIKELIEKTNVKTTNITITEEDGGNTWYSVEVSEPHFFIGHDGEALSALNHLVRRIIESKLITQEGVAGSRENLNSPAILIDINGFQKKRVENVRAIAHMMSERARYFKSNIEVDPMSAFERRVVHEFLSSANDLKTESIGYGGARRVVIKYIGNI
ncbi:MAG: R3H domain-containing nucleic acid-binding protein [Candidatus Paceibacterota bacterium]